MTATGTAILLLAMLGGGTSTTESRGTFDLRQAIALAEPGSVVNVPAGTHVVPGGVVIDKPLTLEGVWAREGAMTKDTQPLSIIDAAGEGDIIRITAPDVTIRHLTLRRTGALLEKEHAGMIVLAPRVRIESCVLEDVLFGVILKGAPDSVIRGNRIGGKEIDIARRGDGIRLWRAENTLIEHNVVHDGRDVVVWYSSNVVLRGNTVQRCRYGMHFMFTDTNTLEDNILEDNSVGAFLMYSKDLIVRRNTFARNRGPSGYGLGLKDMDRVVATGNLFLANRVGAYLDNSPHEVNVYCDYIDNVFAFNEIGVACLPNVKRNRFTGNTFMENLQQVAVIGSGAFTGNDFSVAGRGNYWSDYRGYDADGDGTGDLAYRESRLFENLMEREPALRLFLHSPAQQAIDLAARAFPIVQPEPRVVDDYPQMRVGAVQVPLPQQPSTVPMTLAALGLGAVAALGLFLARIPHTRTRTALRKGACL